MTAHSFTINSKSLYSQLKSILLFAMIFLLMDNSTAKVLKYFYTRIQTGPGRYNYIKKNQVDLLVMGSSTSTCYYGDVISKELGISVLNVGLDGSALIYSRCLLDLVIRNKVKPKILILNIDLFELQKLAWSGNFYSMIEKLAPLYGESEIIDKALQKNKRLEFLKYKICSYKYNDLILSIIDKTINPGNNIYRRTKSPDSELQLPLKQMTLNTLFNEDYDIDEKKYQLYEEIITECRKHDIKIIFVESPKYYPELKMTERDRKLENQFDKLTKDNNIIFIKFTQDHYPAFRTPELFKDVLHLNHKGSLVFSEKLCEELRKHDFP